MSEIDETDNYLHFIKGKLNKSSFLSVENKN
jgi:hypothetical protein